MIPALHIDFETRSTLDLKQVGMWNYARHPSTDVWCMAYAFGEEEPSLWKLGEPLPENVRSYIESGGRVVAHNAGFELEVWNALLVPRFGWPRLALAQTHCTMALAYAMGLPGGLEDAALALGLSALKDAEGRAIMLRMARPRKHTSGQPPIWWDEPERLARLYEYCRQDVRVERELEKRLLQLTEHERRIQVMDWEINQRGVAVDLETAAAGSQMVEEIRERAGRKLAVITNSAVTSPTALGPLKEWCAEQGFPVDSLAKEHLEVYTSLGDDRIPPHVKAALVLRREAGKASVAKLDKMLALAGDDGRLHNWGQYHGAGTGRWVARGVQVHNLVRNMPPPDVVEELLALVRGGEIDWIDTAYGPPMEMISQCLRSFFVAPPGKRLITGDFAAVEGRGTAWISGEEWKLRAFRESDAGRGPGIYELTASKTLGIPVASIGKKSPERQIGKVQELAFGYQGGVGAARKFLPPHMSNTPDKTLNQWKLAWRAEHPMVVDTWRALEDAAIAAVSNPGQEFHAGYGKRGVRFKKAGSFLWCRLPSGRVMCYPYPKLLAGAYRDQLTYMTVPSENSASKIIADVKNANNWARISTYGGMLMENVVQALCRDLLADKMLELHDAGAKIVLHVHDEIVIEVAEKVAEKSAANMQKILRTAPAWAAEFPLWATCAVLTRYRT